MPSKQRYIFCGGKGGDLSLWDLKLNSIVKFYTVSRELWMHATNSFERSPSHCTCSFISIELKACLVPLLPSLPPSLFSLPPSLLPSLSPSSLPPSLSSPSLPGTLLFSYFHHITPLLLPSCLRQLQWCHPCPPLRLLSTAEDPCRTRQWWQWGRCAFYSAVLVAYMFGLGDVPDCCPLCNLDC